MQNQHDHQTNQLGNKLGLLRIKEAAGATGLSHKTLRRLIAQGELAHRRLGKTIFIDAADLKPPRIASRAEILG
jgi:excisionase family DNA binding protein